MKTLITLVALMSVNAFAAQEKFTGVIREVSCNSPSGLGVIELEVREQRTLNKIGLKVNSRDLCGSSPASFSRLASIGFDAVMLGETYLYEVTVAEDFVVGIQQLKKIKYSKFTKGVDSYVVTGVSEAMEWFFQKPAHIQFKAQN